MAIVAHLEAEGFSDDVMVVTSSWEWKVIREGDLVKGDAMLVMVGTEQGDVAVVADAKTATGRNIALGAMRLVRALTGAQPVVADTCHNAAEYWAYRQQQRFGGFTCGIAIGQRNLLLPPENDEVLQIKG